MANLRIVYEILGAVEFLSEVTQFRILKASMAFLQDEEYELNEIAESTAFKMLIPMLIEVKEKDKARSEKMKANGLKGGRKKTKMDNLLSEETKTDDLLLKESKKTNLVLEDPLSSPSSSPSLSSPTPPSNTLSTIPPIIPQENKSSSSCACAREEDFGLQVGVVATIERYVEQYKKEGMWKDVAIQNHLTVEQTQEIFRGFIFDQKHNATNYSNYSDFKRHFLNYIRIRATAIKADQSQEKPKKVISGADVFKVYG